MSKKTADETVYTRSFEIHSFDTNTHGVLGMPMVFNYLQDIAGDHADRLAFGYDDLNARNQFWVLSRMYVQMDARLPWHRKLQITTWPRGTEKLFAIRDFVLADEAGQQLGFATSYWLIVDREKRRPQRVDQLAHEVADPERPPVYDQPLEKLPGPNEGYKTPVFQVRYSDLDLNVHVNNAKYVQWAMDAYPLEFHLKHHAHSIEVNYLHESLPGDEVSIQSQCADEEDNYWLHSVKRMNDGSELARLRIGWNDCCIEKK